MLRLKSYMLAPKMGFFTRFKSIFWNFISILQEISNVFLLGKLTIF